jgi:hypothetical protein
MRKYEKYGIKFRVYEKYGVELSLFDNSGRDQSIVLAARHAIPAI